MNHRYLVSQFAKLLLLAFVYAPSLSQAQNYPSKAVRVIIPFAPGGALDAATRPLTDVFQEKTGQSLVIENMGGAGGVIAANYIVRSQPDGYTLLMGSNGQVSTASYAHADLQYDPRKDLVPVIHISDNVAILYASAKSPYETLADVIQAAKKAPGSIPFAHGGVGGISQLTIDLFAHEAGISFSQIPYKGVGQAMQDVVSGRVPLVVTHISTAMPFVEGKRIKPLAVAAPQRLEAMPDVPTFAEMGLPEVNVSLWIGVMAPRGTPDSVVKRLASILDPILQAPDMKQKLERQGMIVRGGSPADLQRSIDEDFERWGKLAKVVNIQAK